jgi:hypothetical protein
VKECYDGKEIILPPENRIPDVPLGEGLKIRFDLNETIHKQYMLFGRATRVEDVEVGVVEDGEFKSISEGIGLALKVSYQVKTRVLEYKVIERARRVDPVHTHAVLDILLLIWSFLDFVSRMLRRLENMITMHMRKGI